MIARKICRSNKKTCGSNKAIHATKDFIFLEIKKQFLQERKLPEKYKQKILAWQPSEEEQIVNAEIESRIVTEYKIKIKILRLHVKRFDHMIFLLVTFSHKTELFSSRSHLTQCN